MTRAEPAATSSTNVLKSSPESAPAGSDSARITSQGMANNFADLGQRTTLHFDGKAAKVVVQQGSGA